MNLRKPPVLSEEAKARRNANLKPFKKGSSGNPTGRPQEYGKVLHAARGHSLEAIETLVLVMRNGKPGEAMMAAQALLDRAWGRPKVTVDAEIEARSIARHHCRRKPPRGFLLRGFPDACLRASARARAWQASENP